MIEFGWVEWGLVALGFVLALVLRWIVDKLIPPGDMR